MLNSILKKLNGHAADAHSIAGAIEKLGLLRDATNAEIVALRERRHQLVLDDCSNADLKAIEQKIDDAEIKLEKINLSVPGLQERLTAAKKAARLQRWRELHSACSAAAIDFAQSARGTAAKHEALTTLIAQAQREGFEREIAASMPATPAINGNAVCALDLLDAFEQGIAPPAPAKRRAAAKAADPSRPSWWDPKAPGYDHPASASLRKLTVNPDSMQHRVEFDRGVSRPASLRYESDFAPLERGQVRAKVMRAGYSPADDRPDCQYGQVIRMPEITAEAAAERGAIEIIETYDASRRAVSTKPAGDEAAPIKSVGSTAEGATK